MAWLSPALYASMAAEDQAMVLAFEVIRRQEEEAARVAAALHLRSRR